MAIFPSMAITNLGQLLYNKAQAGAALNFTKMKLGAGSLSEGQDPQTLTNLIENKFDVAISSITQNTELKVAVITGSRNNADVTVGTYICELGLYAEDPDVGEILYAYSNAGVQGDYFAPASKGAFTWSYQINAAVGNAADVTATLSSNAFDHAIAISETSFVTISGTNQKEINKSIDAKLTDHAAQQAETVSHLRYIEGMEYLIYYHDKIRLSQHVEIIASGDSTTFGVAVTDSNYLIHTLCKNVLRGFGYTEVDTVNAGHSGLLALSWATDGYIATDLAQNPDLYILRWGLNDGGHTPKAERLAVFTNALRSGLAQVRSTKTVQQLSIILMMPNSTNETGTRDKAWFDVIYPVIKQAARDYQCCFVDTYNYLLDSTNVVWQDDMASNGVHIHPLETANAWIVSLLSEVLMPTVFRKYGVTNPLSSEEVKLVTDAPSTYKVGVSIHRAQSGWAYDGQVITFKSADGIVLQINNSLYSESIDTIAIRRGLAVTGISGSIGDDAWGSWFGVSNQENWQGLTLSNGWVEFGGTNATARYALDKSGNVQVKGMVKSGTITAGTVIATLPPGRRPLEDRYIGVATSAGYGILQITSNGEIKCIGISSSDWIDFGSIVFRAEQ